MKISRFHVLILSGVVLIGLAFTPLQISVLQGWETYFSIRDGGLVAWNSVSVPVWCKTDNLKVAHMYLYIYSDYPESGGYAVVPPAKLTHIVEDAWQGNLQMQGLTRQVNPSSYVFAWLGLDVSGVPVLANSGWVTFSDDPQTKMTISPVAGGVTLPSPGDYWFVSQGGQVVIYAFPDETHRLVGWITNGNPSSLVNPLVLSTILASITFEPMFETNSAPVASFTPSTTEARVDESVNFDASASYDSDGSIIGYSWDFGDASVEEGMVVNHAFVTPASYPVTLTVTDNDGSSTSKTQLISVTGLLPADTYALVISTTEGGTTAPTQNTYTLQNGSTVEITGLPDEGYVLESWLVNGVATGASESITVIMDQPMSVKAQFVEVGQENGNDRDGDDTPIIIPPVTTPQFNLPLFVLGGVLVGSGFIFRKRRQKR